MAKLNISQAARATDKSRSTIQRHIKNGKLSVSHDTAGNVEIDTAELIRVFGGLKTDATVVKHVSDVSKSAAKQQRDTGDTVAIEALQKELDRAREREIWLQKQVDERDEKIKRLEERNEHLVTRLLPPPVEAHTLEKPKQGLLQKLFKRG